MALVKHNNNSISSITSAGQLAQGKMTLISSQTASGSASIEFTSGIDSTYPIYIFKFINIHPQTDGTGENVDFTFQVSTDTGSSYGVAITNTHFRAFNYENASGQGLSYLAGEDFAQSTSFINVTENGTSGGANDEHLTGTFHLFNPSSTTFVKHFITRFNFNTAQDSFQDQYIAGYINSTSAVDAIQFKYSLGNIDSGTIKLYGIKGD